jgi:Spy/CpxP family protein refolding chaperone
LNEVDNIREQQHHAVFAAKREERAAWSALERASRPDPEDETAVSAYRERWRTASRSLVDALRSLKS